MRSRYEPSSSTLHLRLRTGQVIACAAFAAALLMLGLGTAPAQASSSARAEAPLRLDAIPDAPPGWHCLAPGCGTTSPLSNLAGFAAATLGAAWCSRRAR